MTYFQNYGNIVSDQERKKFKSCNLFLDLSLRLQKDLSLGGIMDVFFGFLKRNLQLDGLLYTNPDLNIELSIGKKGQYSSSHHLSIEDTNIGQLELFSCESRSNITTSTIDNMLDILIYPLKNALEYRAALDCSITDHLTGIGNRKSFEFDIQHEIHTQKRKPKKSSLLLLDLDNFKQVNDQLGHIEGDYLLEKVSKVLKSMARKSDLLYRYGGDEFIVFMEDTPIVGAIQLAERIKDNINAELKRYDERLSDKYLSVSIGASEIDSEDDIVSLLDRVDKALYCAKRSGGNSIHSIDINGNNSKIEDKLA